MSGLIIAAPSSGAGKTTVTLALLRLLAREGIAVRGAKSGPDYIDPRFHEAACGAPCPNLDGWAMSDDRLASLAGGDLAVNNGMLIIEGAMGLFDGAPPDGRGSSADLARRMHLPVVLVVDCARMSGSIAPLVAGFARFDPEVRISAVILNNIGSSRHEEMLRYALEPLKIPVLAALRRNTDLAQPSRHLGLVQAAERPDLDRFLDRAADALATTLDQDLLAKIAWPLPAAKASSRLIPPAQVIAIAQDRAFAFSYPHILADWRAAGAEIRPFSPLENEAVPDAGFIFLPGGYPELHARQIAAAETFLKSMRKASQTTDIYGECGGYMTLGNTLVDAEGRTHKMLGLLDLETSFAARKRHLGYRQLTPLEPSSFKMMQGPIRGHEFHYASTIRATGKPLFSARDAAGANLPDMGLRKARVCGSFAHIIDRVT